MAPKEVSAISACGPFKRFRNGDIETYNGVFNGKKENFQFFFQDDKLRRVGIYFYEGNDSSKAVKEWLALRAMMSQKFGSVNSMDNHYAIDSENDRKAFMSKALQIVIRRGETQMIPITKTKNASVYASFMGGKVNEQMYYYVVMFFDRYVSAQASDKVGE